MHPTEKRAHSRSAFFVLLALTGLLAAPAAAQQFLWSQGNSFSTNGFGMELDVVGDLNGDGFSDLVAGDQDASPATFHGGQALVLSGADGSALLSIEGTVPLGGLGRDVAGVGDVSGDGVPDLVVTAHLEPPTLRSGVDGALLYSFTNQASSSASVAAGIGDVNGDGIPEVLLGHPGYDNQRGRFYVASGAFLRSGIGPEFLVVLSGGQPSWKLGSSLASAGDVDLDGVPDVLVSSPGEEGWLGIFHYHGVARVYAGATGATLRTVRYFGVDEGFGARVCGVGDQNGDGASEFAVSAPNVDVGPNQNAGTVWVYDGASGNVRFEVKGTLAGAGFGMALAGAGDVNGDATPDLLVGAPIGAAGGLAKLVSGYNGTVLSTLTGAGGAFGWSVLGGLDLDGDARADFAVDAPFEGPSGKVRAYTGLCTGINVGYCSSLANSYSSNGAQITASGSTSLAAKDLTLIARDCPPGNPGLFFYAADPGLKPFGDGQLCVDGPIHRFLPAAVVDAQGFATHVVDFAAPPISSGPGAIQPGDTRYFQFWFRDPTGGPAGFNTSNGRRIAFCP